MLLHTWQDNSHSFPNGLVCATNVTLWYLCILQGDEEEEEEEDEADDVVVVRVCGIR